MTGKDDTWMDAIVGMGTVLSAVVVVICAAVQTMLSVIGTPSPTVFTVMWGGIAVGISSIIWMVYSAEFRHFNTSSSDSVPDDPTTILEDTDGDNDG